MNKKGIELTLNTVVIAIIVLVVLAVMLLIFGGVIGGSSKPLGCATKLLSTDSDPGGGDGFKDAVDPAPCDPDIPKNCKGPLDQQPACCPGSTNGQCVKDVSCLPKECQKSQTS